MTMQIEWPRTFYILAGQYSGRWDKRAQFWWARRVMDAVTFAPSKLAKFQKPVVAESIGQLEGAAVVQPYDHIVEREIIVPRYNAYVAELKRQFEAGYPIGNDSRRLDHGEINMVQDWLASLDERMLGKLWKVSWKQGLEFAIKWHAVLEKVREERAAGSEGVNRRIESDGWNWCRLGTTAAMDREGVVMGHCVGEGSYDRYADSLNQVTGIWSLRDGNGRSHVTAQLDTDRDGKRRLIQAKGVKNRGLNDGEKAHLDVLLTALEVDTSRPANPYSSLRAAGEMYVRRRGHFPNIWEQIGTFDDVEIQFPDVGGQIVMSRHVLDRDEGIAVRAYRASEPDNVLGQNVSARAINEARREGGNPAVEALMTHIQRSLVHALGVQRDRQVVAAITNTALGIPYHDYEDLPEPAPGEGGRFNLARERTATWGIDIQLENVQQGAVYELPDDFDVAIAGEDLVAGAVVDRGRNGTVIKFHSAGGDMPDGTVIADKVTVMFSSPAVQAGSRLAKTMQPRMAPPPPHYRQHERRGRMHGRT